MSRQINSNTGRVRTTLIWIGLSIAMAIPVLFAATSPLLAWRDWIYITAGFSGIAALSLMLLQPLLAAGYLPGLTAFKSRRLHRWVGALLVSLVVVHVAGLWITSPPDVVDALLFASPTPFSAWGVIAMWMLFASAFLAVLRHRLKIRPHIWRIIHTAFAMLIVSGTVIHALLIVGTMETVTKTILCVLVVGTTLIVVATLHRGRAS